MAFGLSRNTGRFSGGEFMIVASTSGTGLIHMSRFPIAFQILFGIVLIIGVIL